MYLTRAESIIVAVFVALALCLMLGARRRGAEAAGTSGAAKPEWRGFMHFLAFMLVWVVIGAFVWPLVSRMMAAGESRAAAAHPVTPPSPTPPPAPTPTAEPAPSVERREGPINIYTPVTVVDSQNRRAAFTLYTFSEDYHWQKSTYDAVLVNMVKTEAEMMTYLSGIHGDIRLQDAVVCVGTASFDLQDKNDEKFEETRALNRATILVAWIRPAFRDVDKDRGKSPELFKINLGHYTERPDNDKQRMIIIFGVKKVDPEVSLEEIMSEENQDQLKQALTKEGYPFVLTKYSRFDIYPAS